ncbi:maleylpyruvate isomerase N-terminal domain-containing protein [Micromonospora mirobrigensis]|uniref:TIGR03083 family protein n=1 Tax=Micromonospora mirobrigensis TaxID=262898 RepID=A0A1C4X3B8_9ACTN|nr:maleylpyruvate isomerase N-terminal domain-containing protein [Micromonospora mirobrigensis]SCF02661.1 TIGR03083 family protein [Micromonospora mirobrigensis]
METVREAFRDECVRLETVLGDLTAADLDRPTPCPPWRLRDLVAHVRTGVGRLAGMLAEPAPPAAEVDAVSYFGAAKFTPEVDRDRIESARREGAALPGVPAMVADFARAWRATDEAVTAATPDRVVRTRHGEPMTVTEFLRTRVVEVAVHGLDLADALDREPWLTPAAARVAAAVLTGGRPVPDALGWDDVTLLRKVTGRAPLTPEEITVSGTAGLGGLSFSG